MGTTTFTSTKRTQRRIGALLLTGIATGLFGLAAAGTADATPAYPVNPSNPIMGRAASPGATVSLNPQPLPPGPDRNLGGRGTAVSLNPQPLPPGPDYLMLLPGRG
ncbi:MAG: hypothetical protein QOD90_5766 [Mycobacterium sp.]|nr:hypothetical protein [Mycobacterium sp.]